MKSFFKEIFKYQHDTNQNIINALLKSNNEIPPKVLDLLSHSINAQKLWNNRLLKSDKKVEFVTYSLNILKKMDLQNYVDVEKVIETKNLEVTIEYHSTSGKAYRNTLIEILTQISQHFQYHRGQIISVLKKEGIRLKPTDYIYYSRKEL